MLVVYQAIKAGGQPNVWDARIPLPSNFNFHEWEAIAQSETDKEIVQSLRFGFSAGFESPIPSSSSGNHQSLHPCDVGIYIKKETMEGAMLGLFHQSLYPPGVIPTFSSPIPNTAPLIGES